jgi:hypothetical protein
MIVFFDQTNQMVTKIIQKVDTIVNELRNLFEHRTKRSKLMNEKVMNYINAISNLYGHIRLLLPQDQAIEMKSAEDTKKLFQNCYLSLPSLKESEHFFTLLEWSKSVLEKFFQMISDENQKLILEEFEKTIKKGSKISVEDEKDEKGEIDVKDLLFKIEKLEIKIKEYENTLNGVNNYVKSFKDPTLENILIDLLFQSSENKKLEEELLEIIQDKGIVVPVFDNFN